jgi:hypothetical protein
VYLLTGFQRYYIIFWAGLQGENTAKNGKTETFYQRKVKKAYKIMTNDA